MHTKIIVLAHTLRDPRRSWPFSATC